MPKKRGSPRKSRRQSSEGRGVPAVRDEIDSRLDVLCRRVRVILGQARTTVARSVNTQMVRGYWLIGREVAEEEQRGSARAGYGDELVVRLSARLHAEFGRGYTPTNLRYMRLFYLAYPNLLAREIHHPVRDKSEHGAGLRELL